MLAAALIFLGTYLVLALGRLPGFRVDRTGAAIIGASLVMAFEVLTLEEAYAAVDHNTILLLFGMMIVAANLRVSGVFAAVSAWTVRHARHPLTLLGAVILVSGVFSAFFVNDTVCLVLTPSSSTWPSPSAATRSPTCSGWPWDPISAAWPPSRGTPRT